MSAGSRFCLGLGTLLVLSPASAATPDLAAQARAVYADLVRAAGEDRQAPDLVVAPLKDYQVALYDFDSHSITVEPKALSVCASFGAEAGQAMAVLMAHELAHFYLGHAWRADFGGPRGGAPNQPAFQAQNEAQADRQAGFYAYMAGYPTAGAMPRLLIALYRAYGLPDEMPGYPSLQQRCQQAAEIEGQLEPSFWAFEAGKRLLLLGRPIDAALAFDRAAQVFPSREVLCDAAIARMLAARDSLGSDRFPWTLPLPMDLHSRAIDPTTQVARVDEAGLAHQREVWLAQAEQGLERAKLKAPEYLPAQLDLASLHLLQGHWDQARLEGRDFSRVAQAKEPGLALGGEVIQALSWAMEGKREEAEKMLKALPDSAAPWVKLNLKALQPSGAAVAQGRSLALDPDEALAGWQATDRDTFADTDWAWVQLGPAGEEPLNLYHAERAGVFAVRCVRGTDESMAAITLPSYGGQSARGIKLGAGQDEVLKAYGQPQGSWDTTCGQYLMFDHIAFLMRHQKVAEWMLYE